MSLYEGEGGRREELSRSICDRGNENPVGKSNERV